MSPSTINNYKVNLQELQPLQPIAIRTLNETIFNGPLEGGCKTLQQFAKTVEPLQSLQKQFNEGKIDLGFKDKTIAVAKCIGSGLLLLASAVAAAAGLIFFIKTTGAYGPAAYLAALLSIPPMGAAFLFGNTCKNASKIFQRPSPEQLSEELEEAKTFVLDESDKQQIEQVLAELQRLGTKCLSKIETAKAAGANAEAIRLENNLLLLANARSELLSMFAAVTFY